MRQVLFVLGVGYAREAGGAWELLETGAALVSGGGPLTARERQLLDLAALLLEERERFAVLAYGFSKHFDEGVQGLAFSSAGSAVDEQAVLHGWAPPIRSGELAVAALPGLWEKRGKAPLEAFVDRALAGVREAGETGATQATAGQTGSRATD